jgi:ankyrin repeat protein
LAFEPDVVFEKKPPEIIRLLLDAGATVNERDNYGSTPLLLKSMTGYEPEIVRALLDAGADVNARDRSGTAPMHKAYTLEILKVLLDAGADVNARNESGSTPLHGARTPEIAQALLNAGAQVNVRDEFGFTALHCAVGCSGLGTRAEIIQTLLDAGADVHARNESGETPWDLAQANEHIKVTEGYWALSQASVVCGKLCDSVWWDTATPADLQVELDAGANVNTKDKNGKTPWEHAKQSPLKGSKAYWALNEARFD